MRIEVNVIGRWMVSGRGLLVFSHLPQCAPVIQPASNPVRAMGMDLYGSSREFAGFEGLKKLVFDFNFLLLVAQGGFVSALLLGGLELVVRRVLDELWCAWALKLVPVKASVEKLGPCWGL